MDLTTALRNTIARATPRSRKIFGGANAMSWEQVVEFVTQYPVAVVCSVDASGAPHSTGKAALLLDGSVYLGVPEGTAMGRNLRARPKIALAFVEPPWKRHVFIYGSIRLVDERSDEHRRVQAAFRAAHGYEAGGLAAVLPRKVFTFRSSD